MISFFVLCLTMSSHTTETLSLFDIPKIYFQKDFEEEEIEQSHTILLRHLIEEGNKTTEITLELYKRLLYCPNKKDTSVFDRERYYHPGN